MAGKLVNFQNVYMYNDYYLTFLSLVVFLTQLQLLFVLRYSRTICALSTVLSRSANSLLHFAVFSGLVFLTFTLCGALLFENQVNYSTFLNTCQSHVSALLGRFEFTYLVAMYGQLAGLYLLIYVFIMYLLMLNMFISILDDFMGEMADKLPSNADYKVMEFFLQTVKGLVLGKGQSDGKAIGRLYLHHHYHHHHHHHQQLNVYFLPRLIKEMDGCFPTTLGRQYTFSKVILDTLVQS